MQSHSPNMTQMVDTGQLKSLVQPAKSRFPIHISFHQFIQAGSYLNAAIGTFLRVLDNL